MKSAYFYPLQNLRGDYIRALSGASICVAPLVLSISEGGGVTGGLLLLPFFAALFLLYFANTLVKQLSSVAIDDRGISISGFRARKIRWDQLVELKLSYFTTWRGGENGWMQLRLKTPAGVLRLSSALIGFEHIVRVALRSAALRNIALDDVTLKNLNELGLADQAPPPGSVIA